LAKPFLPQPGNCFTWTVTAVGRSHWLKESFDMQQLSPRTKLFVLIAALLAVFLGALDALVIGTAMPTIVADLGGLELYSWVFSGYMLTRTISLPLFGKLSDLYGSKKLFLAAVSIFLLGSAGAGLASNMPQLIATRAIQGFGAGGNFAVAYTVVAEVSPPETRGKMMGLISFVWGVASVLGPILGGFIVTYLAWPWVFYINLPIGGLAMLAILTYFHETRQKKSEASIDYLGSFALSVCILSVLFIFLRASGAASWHSPEIVGLSVVVFLAGLLFYLAEKRAKEPLLPLQFLTIRSFVLANGAAFFSSFAIFSLIAFLPLFIQVSMGKRPAEVGAIMVPLSLGWSAGALFCGQMVSWIGEKRASVGGAMLMLLTTLMTLTFSAATGIVYFSIVTCAIGTGMGFVSVATLLTVQNSLSESDLGLATSSQQFARTLGGTIGIGMSGGVLFYKLHNSLVAFTQQDSARLSAEMAAEISRNMQKFLRPELQGQFPEAARQAVQQAIAQGVEAVFWLALAVCLVSLIVCAMLPALPPQGLHKKQG